MNDKDLTKDEIKAYLKKYFAIFRANFKNANQKKPKFDYKTLHEMAKDCYSLMQMLYKKDKNFVSDISIKEFIPIVNLLIKIDVNPERKIKYAEMLKCGYKWGARNSLEHYMIYREWDESHEDKFFAPRYEIMAGYIHYLQEIATNPKFLTLIAMMPSGYGKLIANDVPVLTKDGWKKHGDLKVGDYVIGKNGEYVRVNIIHPKRLANYKVIFEDGEEILCHNQHEWNVYDREAQKEKTRVETNYIIEHIHSKGGRNRFYLPLCEPVIGEEKKLPVDPYTYGVWLGDGSTSQSRITQNTNDLEIFKYIPYEISNIYDGVSNNVKSYYLKGLETDLHSLNLCYQKRKNEKYINDMYFTSSINQRLELLAGIIDTDGYLDRKKNRYIITTCGEKLKDDIIALISTFHWRVCVTKVKPTISTSGIIGKKDTYYIGFNPTMYIPCKLERKQLKKFSKQRRIGIKDVVPIPLTEGNCITVDGGLYLVGRTLKLTHNTYPEKISEAWSLGKDPTRTILSICSNDKVVKGGSSLVMEEIKGEHFGEVFDEMAYNKDDKGYFLKETAEEWKLRDCKLLATYYTATTLSGIVGVRVSERIHIDDLYPDYKEAMRQELNEYYHNKNKTVWLKRFVQNKKPKEVITGTLWASGDFIARVVNDLKKQYKFHKSLKYKYVWVNDDESVAIVQVPALDYTTGLSTCPEFKSTKDLKEEQRTMDRYLWETNFQQIPTDPEDLFFSYGKLRKYTTIPATDYIGSYAVIDATRKSGKDYFSMPIFKKVPTDSIYDFYLKDVLFTKTATKDMYDDIVDKIIEHHIILLVIESNVTSELKQAIDTRLKQKGILYCTIIEKYNNVPKKVRIETEKSGILKVIVFPEKENYGVETDMFKFMDNLTTYNNSGHNVNDDAPDSLALFLSEIVEENSKPAKVEPLMGIREYI